MALDKAQEYLARRDVHRISDWGAIELDAEGLALQAELERRQTVSFLQLWEDGDVLTRSVPVEAATAEIYQVVPHLFGRETGQRVSTVPDLLHIVGRRLPLILPELLKFLRLAKRMISCVWEYELKTNCRSYAHGSHNPKNWTLLPAEMQSIVGGVLTDRFWQAGISEGSKDDFYARVMDKKNTIEGLASTIRGSVRFVRETCYAIIYCMSRLDMQFYGFLELPGPLANALFADSVCLSAHQLINLLNLVRYLVDNCPVELRDHFLPPILATCFQQMDSKIGSEWSNLDRQGGLSASGDELTEEMKAESILRHLTYTAVVMVADFLDPARASKYSCYIFSSTSSPFFPFSNPTNRATRPAGCSTDHVRKSCASEDLPFPSPVLPDARDDSRTAPAFL